MRKTLVPGAAVVLVAAITIGCGSSPSGDSETTATTTARAGGDPQAVRDCLEKAGIDVPEGAGPRTFEPGDGGAPPEGFDGGPPPDGAGPPDGAPPDGDGGPPQGGGFLQGEDGEKARKALEDCGIELPKAQMRRRATGPEFRESVEKYVACVRENGYDLPDPDLSGDGPAFDEDSVDRDDPAFQKASRECQELLRPPRDGGGQQQSSS